MKLNKTATLYLSIADWLYGGIPKQDEDNKGGDVVQERQEQEN